MFNVRQRCYRFNQACRQLLKRRFSKPKIQLDKLQYLLRTYCSGCLLRGYISLNTSFYYLYCKCVFKLEAIYFYVCKGNKYADYLQNYMHFTESDQNCRRFRVNKMLCSLEMKSFYVLECTESLLLCYYAEPCEPRPQDNEKTKVRIYFKMNVKVHVFNALFTRRKL